MEIIVSLSISSCYFCVKIKSAFLFFFSHLYYILFIPFSRGYRRTVYWQVPPISNINNCNNTIMMNVLFFIFYFLSMFVRTREWLMFRRLLLDKFDKTIIENVCVRDSLATVGVRWQCWSLCATAVDYSSLDLNNIIQLRASCQLIFF